MMNRRCAAALLGLCIVLRLGSLLRPCLSDDEATYAVVARDMLAGHALYRDVVDHKPPAIYLVGELTQAIGGPIGGMVLLHVLLIAVVWATGMLLASLVRRFEPSLHPPPTAPGADMTAAGERGPVIAALLYIVFTTTLIDVDSLAANCELFMMLPLVASMTIFVGARDRLLHYAASGALIGIGMLFKYQAGIQLPLLAVALVIAQRRAPIRAVLGVVALGTGTAIPALVTIAWLWSCGALHAAWFWFRFNFAYINTGANDSMLSRMVIRGGFVVLAALPLYAMAIAAVATRRYHRPGFRKLMLGWAAVGLVAVAVGGRFFGHYFHQVTPALAILATPIALELVKHRPRLFAVCLALPATVFFVLTLIHDRMMAAAGEPDPDYQPVVSWLDDHAPRSSKLCIWGNSPNLYFDAHRPLGCRFVFANYLTGLSPATSTQTDPEVDSSANIVPEAWDMLEIDLLKRTPQFIVDGSPGNVAFYGKYPPSKFLRLWKILQCNYEPTATVAGMRIYRRLAIPRCTSPALDPSRLANLGEDGLEAAD